MLTHRSHHVRQLYHEALEAWGDLVGVASGVDRGQLYLVVQQNVVQKPVGMIVNGINGSLKINKNNNNVDGVKNPFYAGFETCFGTSTLGAGTKQSTSQIQTRYWDQRKYISKPD